MKRWNPKPYQKKCSDRGFRQSLALFLDPGLGKTSITLNIICKLLKYKKAKKGALVIAPSYPCTLTWPEEIKQWSNFCHLNYKIINNKQTPFNQFRKPIGVNPFSNKYRKTDIFLINPERVTWLFSKVLSRIPSDKWPFDILVIDESSRFKRTQSDRTRAVMSLARFFKYRYLLNGTPTGNGYLGLFSQMFIVDLGETLGVHKGKYIAEYFKQVGHHNSVFENYELQNQEINSKQIMQRIKKNVICLKAEDYETVPSLNLQPKFITLPKKALKIYEQIEDDLFTEIDDKKFIAQSASVKAQMLHQLCTGNLYYTPDPLEPYIAPIKRGFSQVHKSKLEALQDLIEELQGQQLLIGYHHQHDAEILQRTFKKNITVFNLTPKNKKPNIQSQWNRGKIQLLAGQMSSIGFGLNLQKSSASYIALYSLSANFEVFDQFIRRLRRSGNQSQTIFVYIFLAKNLYDHLIIYPRLTKRRHQNNDFFDLMKLYQQLRQNL